ncbi:MAG: glycoside hydrolase, partial [Armatimonadota bacterium]
MRRPLLCLLVLVALSPTFAQTVTHSGQLWQLQNKSLKVSVDAQAGTFSVLDKQSGHLWKNPDQVAQQTTLLLVPQTSPAPKIDGELSEWVDKGALIELGPTMLAEGSKPDSAADSSARVRVLWEGGNLYLAADIKDDKLLTPAAEEAEWWQKDSVEFWLNDTQYALRFGPWGANFWSSGGNVAGARGAWRKTDTGYQLEMELPSSLFGEAKLGGQFRFAFGLNDCDGDQRQTQLYYPAGWAHSNSATFAQTVLADAEGKGPVERPELKAALEPTQRPVKAGQMEFLGSVKSGSKTIPAFLTFGLLGDGPDLQITVDLADRNQAIGRFSALPPLVLDRPGRIIAAVYNDGLGVRTDDTSYRGRQWSTSGSLDMPWVGLTDGKLGYMLLWELPSSCDNGAASLDGVTVDGKLSLAPSAVHEPIMGKFDSPRVIRYSFAADGGYVTLCKRFREYMKGQGMFVTQREKLRRKPQLANLQGAPDIWGRGDLKFVMEAKAAGMDRLLLNAGQPKADMLKIEALGMLMGRYDNYEDAFQGDQGAYGEFVTDRDTVILADGKQMLAWNTKGSNPKQYMKRCASLFEKVARIWIPKDLEVYPYNARFLDVTTATGLQECYSPTHPHSRTEDREAKRRLARYVGGELKLVLGGEHGRWWGADLYDYWEGMQSGGFYSWPAGYVGEDMPKTRADVSQAYQEWGLGETNRYPLWELCYHDCVVSTWYWGDSTGHLIATMPELGFKQDAFNVLYGTVPLYWVSQPYSYNWSKPALRERLLESYRNTCKLHEQIGFEEMKSHEFVTEDRRVQHTVFGEGTNVWVNFGEQPWTLSYKGQQYALPQNGFYAQGPKIEQYRVLKGAERVTYIKSDGYLFADANVPGVIEFAVAKGRASGAAAPTPEEAAFTYGGGQTVRVEGPGRLRVNFAPGTQWVELNPSALCPGSGRDVWRIVDLDQDGQARNLGALAKTEGGMLRLQPGGAQSVVLVGTAALADHAELALDKPVLSSAQPKQGQPLVVTVKVTNLGGKPARAVPLRLLLGAETMTQTKLNVPATQSVEAKLTLETTTWDGPLALTLQVAEGAQELCKLDNSAALKVDIAPDWTRWASHYDVTVKIAAGVTQPLARLPLTGADTQDKDLTAMRVALVTATGQQPCTTQVVPAGDGHELLWQLPPGTTGTVPCRVYLDSLHNKRHSSLGSGRWNLTANTYHGDSYAAQFVEGYLKGVFVGEPSIKVLSSLGASSKDTGWVDEEGTVQSFEVVADGPVCTQVRVKKKLSGNHFYDKLYTFYPDCFDVKVLDSDRFGTMSRAYYLADGLYEDDKGLKAVVDGTGDAEGISGANKNPKWYVIHGAGYAITNVPLTPFYDIGYWDAGNKAGVGYSGPQSKDPETVRYYLRALAPGEKIDAAEIGRRDA